MKQSVLRPAAVALPLYSRPRTFEAHPIYSDVRRNFFARQLVPSVVFPPASINVCCNPGFHETFQRQIRPTQNNHDVVGTLVVFALVAEMTVSPQINLAH